MEICSRCNGSGQLPYNIDGPNYYHCPDCGGTGWLKEVKPLTLEQDWRRQRFSLAVILLFFQAAIVLSSFDKAGVIYFDLNGISFVAPEFTFATLVYLVGLGLVVLIGLGAVLMMAFAPSKFWTGSGCALGLFNLYVILEGVQSVYHFLSR